MGQALSNRAIPKFPEEVAWQLPEEQEPCRFDLRENRCFPYPPVENQGSEVTCVAHAFSMALYCAERKFLPDSTDIYYPEFEQIFQSALRQSPDKNRGVSFEAIATGIENAYGSRMKALRVRYAMVPNSAKILRKVLLAGAPIIAGYQVNAVIEQFHRSSKDCERHGYMLPSFELNDFSISGHTVLILGYDFKVHAFIVRNSWGLQWGVDGHFLIPFQAIEKEHAFTDLWALEHY